MSQQQSRCTKGSEINHPGAFGRHAKACDVCTREGNPDAAIDPDYVSVNDIRPAVREASAEAIDATLEAQDYKPGKSDTREEAAAKALVRAKGGDAEAFATVFDECAAEDCDYGCNGFDETTCKWCDPAEEPQETTADGGSQESSGEAGEALETSGEVPSQGKIAGMLIREGMDPSMAGEASEFVREAMQEGATGEEAAEAFQAIHL